MNKVQSLHSFLVGGAKMQANDGSSGSEDETLELWDPPIDVLTHLFLIQSFQA